MMNKYRSRPVVVEAMQWHGVRTDGPTPVPPGVYLDDNLGPVVITIHGQVTKIEPGDWVIVESQQPTPGLIHAYPCKPDVFAAKYEEVR